MNRSGRLLAYLLTVLCVGTVWADPPAPENDPNVPKIGWQDAARFYNTQCLVYGKVINAKTITSFCFLNFDSDYRTTFTIAIPKQHWDKFPEAPEKMYNGKDVAVFGEIVEYKGKPEIVVTAPDQIRVGVTLPAASEAKPAAVPGETAKTGAKSGETAKPETVRKEHVFSGACTIASFNVENLFDDQDDPYRRDEGTEPKSSEQMQLLAEVLRRMDADVVALQEVENRWFLEQFVKSSVPDLGYEHVVQFEGNDQRGIDVAVLSRLPVGPVTSHRHLKFKDSNGQDMSFHRDLLQVRIEPPGVPPFDVFAIHLKSKGGGEAAETLAIRMGEARQIRSIFDEMLARDGKARFVLCGDYNDTLDSQPLQTIIGEGSVRLVCFAEELPESERITYNKEPYRSMIDFILASPAMAEQYRKSSYRIHAGTEATIGSDHNPLSATFDLK